MQCCYRAPALGSDSVVAEEEKGWNPSAVGQQSTLIDHVIDQGSEGASGVGFVLAGDELTASNRPVLPLEDMDESWAPELPEHTVIEMGEREYSVTVTNLQEGGVGLQLKQMGVGCLVVRDIKEGAITQWNRDAGEDQTRQVRELDHLLSVNGINKDMQSMINALREAGELTLSFRRPMRMKLSLTKAGKRLGLKFKTKPGLKALIVTEIFEGVLMTHNKMYPEEPVRPGDYIVSVNDAANCTRKMTNFLHANDHLEVLVDHVST